MYKKINFNVCMLYNIDYIKFNIICKIMYSLYDLFVSDDDITESIGYEYNNLINIVEMLNNFKDEMVYNILPNEILREILLKQNDLNTIISMYNTNKYFRELLDDTNVLKELMLNITNTTIKLPGYRWNSYRFIYSIDHEHSNVLTPIWDIVGITLTTKVSVWGCFEEFIKWYRYNFYTDKCTRSNIICYSAAITNNDIDNINKYSNKIITSDLIDSKDIIFIQPGHLLKLIEINRDKLTNEQIYNIYIKYLRFHLAPAIIIKELSENDISIISEFIMFIKDYEKDNVVQINDIIDIIDSSLIDEKIFKIMYDTFIKHSDNHILYELENQIITNGVYNLETDTHIRYLKYLSHIVTKSEMKEIIERNLELIVDEYLSVDNTTFSEYEIESENTYIKNEYFDELSRLFELIRSYIGNELLIKHITNKINKLNIQYYSFIISFITDYIDKLQS